MKLLIVDHYYPAFFKTYYQRSTKSSYSYKKQHHLMMQQLFSTADFYSKALTKIGHLAETVVVNDDYLQMTWLKENGHLNLTFSQCFFDLMIKRSSFLRARKATNWEQEVLRQQVLNFKPDVLYIHNLSYLSQSFLRSLKPQVKVIAGQIACPLPPFQSFKAFDLVITSFPHFVSKFQEWGISAEYLPLCFEPAVLKKLKTTKRILPVTFIGSITSAHQKGTDLIQQLAKKIPLKIWGYGKQQLDPNSAAFKYHQGEVWGQKMYQLFSESKITLNRHISVAGKFANNLRLFEATGCGALLITDQKNNLNQLFTIDKEIVTYSSGEELVAKVKYYLTHDRERNQVARAGQRRTLSEHTYNVRMKQLVKILERYL